MKKLFLLLIVAIMIMPAEIYSQSRAMRIAADKSFSDAEKNMRKGNYKEAAANYEIVLNAIPITTDSRSDLMMRLDATTALIDIYVNYRTNFEHACEKMDIFSSDMQYIQKADILRGRQLYRYLQLEKDYAKYDNQCKRYRSLESDKDDFEKIFDQQFDD
jgi:outer membrane protein assembly factor BamD (BamD/ComL family)